MYNYYLSCVNGKRTYNQYYGKKKRGSGYRTRVLGVIAIRE